MIEFGGDKIGHPWHGLYRASTGKITTPAGGDIDRPGSAPSNGDVYLVQIPGLPEPEATPAEAADGQTWLNYALISGKTLYARQLDYWLYIDDDGQPWAVEFESFSGSRPSQTLSVQIRLREYGVFAHRAAITQLLPVVSIGFSLHPDYSFSNQTSGSTLLDVFTNGRKALLGVHRTMSVAPFGRAMSAVAELTITGSPTDGSASASLVLVADESSHDSYTEGEVTPRGWLAHYRVTDWSAAPQLVKSWTGNHYPPPRPGNYTNPSDNVFYFDGTRYSLGATYELIEQSLQFPESVQNPNDGIAWFLNNRPRVPVARPEFSWTRAVGARYNQAGDVEVLQWRYGFSESYECEMIGMDAVYVAWDDLNPGGMNRNSIWRFNEQQTIVIQQSLIVGGSVSVTDTTTYARSSNQTAPQGFESGAVFETSVTLTSSAGAETRSGMVFGPIRSDPYTDRDGGAETATSGKSTGLEWLWRSGGSIATRFSNSVYAAQPRRIGFIGSSIYGITWTSYGLGALVGRAGSVAPESSNTTSASENPKTGEIAQGASTVCWV